MILNKIIFFPDANRRVFLLEENKNFLKNFSKTVTSAVTALPHSLKFIE